MIHPIQVKNITLGEGSPKICAPIISTTQENLLKEIQSLLSLPIDLIEWRVDFYEKAFDKEDVLSTLQALRNIIPSIPLIFTFRTKKEGGEKEISTNDYFSLLLSVAKSQLVDFIDVEYLILSDRTELQKKISQLQNYGTKIILSNHDFYKTPPKEELIHRLQDMLALNCDIPKIAVMPLSPYDVLTLLEATYTVYTEYSTKPIVTMSMSVSGCISRLAGEIFGSCITFGSAAHASAPGQIPISQLNEILSLFHS